jgi:fructose-specific component phosphotransferase system IIB-like protein
MSCGCEDKTLDNVTERAKMAIEESKKLTTKDRKKLQKSTFCGPNRSFPVPDCKHVGTAKAYLGRSNFSAATKKKIAACINRKAKALGCSSGKKAKASEEVYPKYIELSAEEKRLYSSDIFQTTKELVDESIKNPGLELFEEDK